jgi:hypothetical protein
MDTIIDKRIRFIGWLLFFVCILWCVWIVISAIIDSQTTGILYVSSSNSQASLIVSQNDRQALLVGIGVAKVRLKPGSYQVSASIAGKQANSTVEVYKKHTTTSHLNPSRLVKLPSVTTINFEGTGALINNGLTTQQVSNLEQEFFEFKHSAQTVSINTSSVEPGPHNPNIDISFTLNFTVSIDSITYRAAATYTNLETVQLSLYNLQNNALLFNSNTISTPGGD